MTVETYGEHAEWAARALNRLLQLDAIPTDSDAVDLLLHCREAVLDALRQRLHAFGLSAGATGAALPAPAAGVNLEGIDNKLATLLDNIAFALPTLPPDERRAPSEVLAPASTDLTVESWRQAAIESLAASHALDAAADKPWLRNHGAGWYLLGDVAVALEAMLVLDARLAEVGLLTGHHHHDYPMSLEARRLVTSQAARVATWYATNSLPDLATPRPPVPTSSITYPIALVSAPEDLAAAQDRLAAFLRPLTTLSAAYAGEPEITADAARHVTASQLFVCRELTTMAAASPKTTKFVPFFDDRAEVLKSLQPQIRHLIDLTAHEPNRRRFWQQGEITTAITRMRASDVDLRLQPHQMLALANATHEATRNLGRTLRRELLRSNSNLRDANPNNEDGPMRVGRRSRLERTLTDLVNMAAPSIPAARFSTPLQRAALRQSLDMIPSSPRPPSPYPAVGSVSGEIHTWPGSSCQERSR